MACLVGDGIENDFVAGVYEKLASVYDFTFGPTLHAGRLRAIQRMGIRPGDRVLEVGVGTAINAGLYPRDCIVTGIDLSAYMLEKARERVARKDISTMRLLEMDAADLRFADGAFDIVCAPWFWRRSRSHHGRARWAVCAGLAGASSSSTISQPQSAAGLDRACDFAVHRAHRLQIGSRPAGVSRPGGSRADPRSKRSTFRGSGRLSLVSRNEPEPALAGSCARALLPATIHWSRTRGYSR